MRQAVPQLRQALAIYQRLSSPAAASLEQILHHHDPGHQHPPAPPAPNQPI
jgi:hypothetical protein